MSPSNPPPRFTPARTRRLHAQKNQMSPSTHCRLRRIISGRSATLSMLIILALTWLNLAFIPAAWDEIQPATPQPEDRAEIKPVEPDNPPPPPPPTPTSLPTAAPVTEANHVVIISIDGLRPDALDLAHTPTMDYIKTQGTYFPNAQTVKLSRTLPSHASMLTGVVPEKHGLMWGLPYIGWPGLNGPTLLNVAHDAGLNTAMVFGKKKLDYLVLPNSVDEHFGADVHDEAVKDEAVKMIQAGLPNVLFIHFPDTDRVGHAYGWMSENQLYAISFVDGMIGEVVAALYDGGYLSRTLLIITSDHGGHGFIHGDDSPEDRTIPWLAMGPGVMPNIVNTKPINTYDTAATTLFALNLPIPNHWDGQPVMEIFQAHYAHLETE